MKVFLSHSTKDKQFVEALADELKTEKIESWLCEVDIEFGENFVAKIEEGLRDADLAVLHGWLVELNTCGSLDMVLSDGRDLLAYADRFITVSEFTAGKLMASGLPGRRTEAPSRTEASAPLRSLTTLSRTSLSP